MLAQKKTIVIIAVIAFLLITIGLFLALPKETGATVPSKSTSVTTTTTQPKSLEVKVNVERNPITQGNDQTVNVIVMSAGQAVSDVSISGVVTYESGYKQSFSGSTDTQGKFTFSWKIGGNSDPGTFTVNVTASKTDYISGQSSTNFIVNER